MTTTLKQLRAALKRCNLSELARRSGVDLRLLRRIRNEDNTPRPSTVERIAPHLEDSRK